MKLIHPKTGDEIIGLLEVVHGTAGIDVVTDPDEHYDGEVGGVRWAYSGHTEIFWDDQKTVMREGKKVYVSDAGDETTEPVVLP